MNGLNATSFRNNSLYMTLGNVITRNAFKVFKFFTSLKIMHPCVMVKIIVAYSLSWSERTLEITRFNLT